MINSEYCHLHVHNEFSLLDGLGTAAAYIKRAKEMGFTALGLTNHGNIDGLIQFQGACDKEGISPVMGCEAYIVPNLAGRDKKEKRGHVTILIKNEQGFVNLSKMLTVANLNGFYWKPRIDYDLLLKNCEGLIILTGCGSSFLGLPGGVDFMRLLKEKIPGDVYLEIMPHNIQEQIDINSLCLDLEDDSIHMVATNDCHFILQNDRSVHEVLLAIQTKAKWTDNQRFRFKVKGLHLRNVAEMIAAFKEQGAVDRISFLGAMKRTMEVAEKCKGFRIPKREIYLPTVPGYENIDAAGFLWNECERRLLALSEDGKWETEKINLYFERLSEEWELINKKKFAPYLMIVWELVQWCKKEDIMTGPGRGSVGGCLIAFLLGITCVDPIKYGLLFSRFVNEDRIDYPDIDIDFEDVKRDLVREHLEQLYGHDNIASISTFLTMQARAVIHDVSRVFDVPLKEVTEFTKTIDQLEEEESIDKACHATPTGEMFYSKYRDVVEIAKRLEGQIKGVGQHAAGVIVSADDLRSGTRGHLVVRSGQTVINWRMADIEHIGLMKLDVLSLNTLTILNETRRLAKESGKNKRIDFEGIPLNDSKVYREISAGHNVGIFQLNTYTTSRLATEIKCKNILELSDIIALVRPGPSDSGMTEEYIQRKKSGKHKAYAKAYEDIVKGTHGIIVYQEQIMEVIYKVAGLPYTTADKIRKVISKKRDAKEFEPFRIMFVEGCKKKGIITEKQAEGFWEMLQSHARYGFNLSHSVEYAILAYWTAWTKMYFPTEFICANLSYGSKGKKGDLVEEAYRLGLSIALPEIGRSDPLIWKADGSTLIMPLVEIKGVGDTTAQKALASSEPVVKTVVKEEKAAAPAPKIKGFFSAPEEVRRPKVVSVTKQPTQNKVVRLIGEINELKKAEKWKELAGYFSFPLEFRADQRDQYPVLLKTVPFSFPKSDLVNILELNLPANYLKGLISPRSFRLNEAVLGCYDCGLSKETEYGPVPCSPGKYNVMIFGEAPGSDEDKQGQGFVGRAGDLLWGELGKYNLFRADFHVTNVSKCFPSISRTPSKEHIEACRKWTAEEIDQLKPCLILAFGNTGLKYFAGKDGGIVDMNGKTQWSEKYGCWICWCVHPSYVLRNPKERRLFDEGILNFSNKISVLGDFE